MAFPQRAPSGARFSYVQGPRGGCLGSARERGWTTKMDPCDAGADAPRWQGDRCRTRVLLPAERGTGKSGVVMVQEAGALGDGLCVRWLAERAPHRDVGAMGGRPLGIGFLRGWLAEKTPEADVGVSGVNLWYPLSGGRCVAERTRLPRGVGWGCGSGCQVQAVRDPGIAGCWDAGDQDRSPGASRGYRKWRVPLTPNGAPTSLSVHDASFGWWLTGRR